MRLLVLMGCLVQLVLLTVGEAAEPVRYRYPKDESVLDAKRDFGAKGDGVADDTNALQAAIEASCGHRDNDPRRGKTNLLFLPNGTYRVTKTLVVRHALGPWIAGESRDGVVIKLDDGVTGVLAVIRTHPNDEGPTSADWFMRNLRHFTVDVGNNPDVDGIRYYATNSGCLQDVRVIGRGKVGVNAGFLGQSGPNLVQDVEIEGFETGLLSQWIWGQTLSRVRIRNCHKVGLAVNANVVAAEDLVVENTPLAVEVSYPNDWYHWGGILSLVGARLTTENSAGPAISNTAGLYARNVTTRGYQKAIASRTERGDVNEDRVDEYLSFTGKKLFPESPERSLQLPIEREPVVAWESDPKKWFCLDEAGVVAGDNADDSEALQKALNQAAAKRCTVAYFRGCGGPEPNWFNLSRPVHVPAPIRLVLGLGWARLIGAEEGGFVVDDRSAPIVKFQNIDSFGGSPIRLTNAAKRNTMVVESCGVSIIGDGGGKIFATDCPAGLHLKRAGQSCWARQLNPEGNSDDGLVQNDGGDLWALGVKHEGRGVRFATRKGGRTEVFGLFNYGGYPDEDDLRPLFVIENASFTVAGLREIAFDSHTATNKVREVRGTDLRVLDKSNEGGWIGWTLYSGYPQPSKR